jgi:hypothetical protein
MAKSKLARYRSKRPAKKNPITESAAVDLGMQVGAGFAGYTTTRFLMRAAYSQAVKRWPKLAKHIGVLTSAVGATGVYFGTKYWEKAEDYHYSATIGAGIAVLQSVLQTYVPGLGWIVSDMDPSQYTPKLPEAEVDDLAAFGIDDPEPQMTSPQITSNLDRLLAANNDFEAVPFDTPAHEATPAPAPDVPDIPEFADDDLEHFNPMLN